jgi:hypothetical protein
MARKSQRDKSAVIPLVDGSAVTVRPLAASPRGWRDMEALWKPQPPGWDPPRPAQAGLDADFIGRDPDLTRSRPPSLGLCKQEVTGSIPVGSTGKCLQRT